MPSQVEIRVAAVQNCSQNRIWLNNESLFSQQSLVLFYQYIYIPLGEVCTPMPLKACGDCDSNTPRKPSILDLSFLLLPQCGPGRRTEFLPRLTCPTAIRNGVTPKCELSNGLLEYFYSTLEIGEDLVAFTLQTQVLLRMDTSAQNSNGPILSLHILLPLIFVMMLNQELPATTEP